MISGKQVKKLNLTLIDYYSINPTLGRTETPFSTEFEFISNDSIFFYDSINDTFYLKYDFGGSLGDLLAIHKHATECSNSSFQTTDNTSIISIGFDTLNNLIFPSIVYDVNLSTSEYLVGKVLKNIGSRLCFYPTINSYLCTNPYPEYIGLIYYSDNDRGTVITSNHPIQNILPIVEYKIIIKPISSNILVFPNPTSSELFLEDNNYNLSKYEVFDVSGRMTLSGSLYQNKIDVSMLSNGIYFINFYSIEGKTYFSKFIKS